MSLKKSVKSSEGPMDFFSSASSFKENQSIAAHDHKSKAYAAAMKALQDKIVILESENDELKDQLNHTQQRFFTEKQELEHRCIEAKRLSELNEKSLKSRINDLELSEKSLQKACRKQEELVKFYEVKAKYNEDQLSRVQDQYNIDKENIQLESDLFKKRLNEGRNKEQGAVKELEKANREVNLLKEKLKQQRKMTEALHEEVEFLRENNEVQRAIIEEHFKSIKSDLVQKNQESLQVIKQLNIKNKGLQRNLVESKKQGDYYKIQFIKLSHRGKESLDLAQNMKKSRSKSRNFLVSKPNNRSSTPILQSYDFTAINSAPAYSDEDDVTRAISSTESEIKKLSDKYSRLQSVELETEEIESYRRNLEDICVSMERKNKELYELKKKQQESLKLKLIR